MLRGYVSLILVKCFDQCSGLSNYSKISVAVIWMCLMHFFSDSIMVCYSRENDTNI